MATLLKVPLTRTIHYARSVEKLARTMKVGVLLRFTHSLYGPKVLNDKYNSTLDSLFRMADIFNYSVELFFIDLRKFTSDDEILRSFFSTETLLVMKAFVFCVEGQRPEARFEPRLVAYFPIKTLRGYDSKERKFHVTLLCLW